MYRWIHLKDFVYIDYKNYLYRFIDLLTVSVHNSMRLFLLLNKI